MFLYFHQHAINSSLMLFFFLLLHLCCFMICVTKMHEKKHYHSKMFQMFAEHLSLTYSLNYGISRKSSTYSTWAVRTLVSLHFS